MIKMSKTRTQNKRISHSSKFMSKLSRNYLQNNDASQGVGKIEWNEIWKTDTDSAPYWSQNIIKLTKYISTNPNVRQVMHIYRCKAKKPQIDCNVIKVSNKLGWRRQK